MPNIILHFQKFLNKTLKLVLKFKQICLNLTIEKFINTIFGKLEKELKRLKRCLKKILK